MLPARIVLRAASYSVRVSTLDGAAPAAIAARSASAMASASRAPSASTAERSATDWIRLAAAPGALVLHATAAHLPEVVAGLTEHGVDAATPVAIPYGVYDLAANAGWVSVGVDHDTAAFAVQTIRTWWQSVGAQRYPTAARLTITADGGGSNGSRLRLWKRELQMLADELGIAISVHHFPPGTSKWNRIGVSRAHLRRWKVWSCMRDGGWPPEAGSQVLVSNHCKLRPSKAVVVSVAAKGGTGSRQVRSREASESKPSMTCRNSIGDVKTGGAIFSRDQRGGGPEACPSGIRHVGGAKPDQALVWNVRTCRSDAKGDVQATKTARARVPMRGTGAESSVVGLKVL